MSEVKENTPLQEGAKEAEKQQPIPEEKPEAKEAEKKQQPKKQQPKPQEKPKTKKVAEEPEEEGEKLKTKAQLIKEVAPYFKDNPKARAVHACQDGHFYPEHLEGLALAHNQDVVKGKVFTINREDLK